MSFSQVTVTGPISLPGNPSLYGCTVTAELSGPISDGATTHFPTPVVAACNASGNFSMTLWANNDPTTVPTGTWHNFSIANAQGKVLEQLKLVVPYTSGGGSIALTALSPPASSGGGGGALSLTGPGQLASPGALTQAGGFTADDTLGTGNELEGIGGDIISDASSAGVKLEESGSGGIDLIDSGGGGDTLSSTGPLILIAGLAGSLSARIVGVVTNQSPASAYPSQPFLANDLAIDTTGAIWMCTASGTPGTWVKVGGSVVENVNTQSSISGTYTLPDVTSDTMHNLTFSGNTTLVFPTAAAGKSFLIKGIQNGTGGYSVTWPSMEWAGVGAVGAAPVLPTAAGNAWLVAVACVDGSNWDAAYIGEVH